MTYGLQIFDNSGAKTFDSTTARGGCVVDIITAGATPQTKVYDAFTNDINNPRVAYALLVGGYATAPATASIVNGHPAITIPAYFSPTWYVGVYMVFIK